MNDRISPETEQVPAAWQVMSAGDGVKYLFEDERDAKLMFKELDENGWTDVVMTPLYTSKPGLAPTPDLEKFCIAFAWAYGTELEREHFEHEPDDGLTPQELWDKGTDEERDFMRRVMRNTFAALQGPDTSTDRHLILSAWKIVGYDKSEKFCWVMRPEQLLAALAQGPDTPTLPTHCAKCGRKFKPDDDVFATHKHVIHFKCLDTSTDRA